MVSYDNLVNVLLTRKNLIDIMIMIGKKTDSDVVLLDDYHFNVGVNVDGVVDVVVHDNKPIETLPNMTPEQMKIHLINQETKGNSEPVVHVFRIEGSTVTMIK